MPEKEVRLELLKRKRWRGGRGFAAGSLNMPLIDATHTHSYTAAAAKTFAMWIWQRSATFHNPLPLLSTPLSWLTFGPLSCCCCCCYACCILISKICHYICTLHCTAAAPSPLRATPLPTYNTFLHTIGANVVCSVFELDYQQKLPAAAVTTRGVSRGATASSGATARGVKATNTGRHKSNKLLAFFFLLCSKVREIEKERERNRETERAS